MISIFPDDYAPAKPIRTANEWMSTSFPKVAEIHPFAFNEVPTIEDSPLVQVLDLDDNFWVAVLGPLGNPAAPVVHHEGQFYRYTPDTGVYQELHPDRIFAEWSLLIDRCAQAFGDRTHVQSFQTLKRMQTLHRPLRRARQLLQAADDLFQDNSDRYLAVQNGVLDCRTMDLLPSSPSVPFRYSLPVEYAPEAKPDNFLGIFRHVLSPGDLSLLQQYLGSLLLPKNYPQRILIIAGDAGFGKGVILRLVEAILGSDKIGILRSQLFTDRFELARFEDKKLLINPDAPTDLLNTPKASILKQLVGGDLIWADVRGKDPIQIHGDFSIILCCNGKPRIPIDQDADAWERRLAVIEVKRPAEAKKMGKLSEILTGVEKSGFLNWMLEGRQQVVDRGYQISLNEVQSQRVMQLVSESNSHNQFVRECLEPNAKESIAAEELRSAYVVYCREKDLSPVGGYAITEMVADSIQKQYGVRYRHDIPGSDGKARRGWKGLRLKAVPSSAALSLS